MCIRFWYWIEYPKILTIQLFQLCVVFNFLLSSFLLFGIAAYSGCLIKWCRIIGIIFSQFRLIARGIPTSSALGSSHSYASWCSHLEKKHSWNRGTKSRVADQLVICGRRFDFNKSKMFGKGLLFDLPNTNK